MRTVQIKEDDKGHKSDITVALKSATVKKIFLARNMLCICQCPPCMGQVDLREKSNQKPERLQAEAVRNKTQFCP